MRGIFFEEDHARAAALVLVQADFSAEVVRERLAGEDADEDSDDDLTSSASDAADDLQH